MNDPVSAFYQQHAQIYERLVARQDHHGNLLAALNEVLPLSGLDVVEFGAGTGNLTRLLTVQVHHVHAFDIEPAMLARAQSQLEDTGMRNWSLALGNNSDMPVAPACADLVIEGWSFAHVLDRYPQDWLSQAAAMLDEMQRILKPGGTAILIEDLGIGKRQPQAPSEAAARLYAWWEERFGFARRWIRTDYHFASPAEADELTRFFFGNELATGNVMLPECTGLWWKHFD